MKIDLNDRDIASLLFLNHDEIDYASFGNKTLARLALAEEPYIATSALMELWKQDPSFAASTAESILSSEFHDKYLDSTAFSLIAKQNPARAGEIALTLVNADNSVLLGDIMKLTTERELDDSHRERLISAIGARLSDGTVDEGAIDEWILENFKSILATHG